MIPGHTNFTQSGNETSEKGHVFLWTESSADGMTDHLGTWILTLWT